MLLNRKKWIWEEIKQNSKKWICITTHNFFPLLWVGNMRILLTASSGAATERREQRRQQVLLSKARLLLQHEEHCPGGHALKLQGCQLVFEVQEVKNLENSNNTLQINTLLSSPTGNNSIFNTNESSKQPFWQSWQLCTQYYAQFCTVVSEDTEER